MEDFGEERQQLQQRINMAERKVRNMEVGITDGGLDTKAGTAWFRLPLATGGEALVSLDDWELVKPWRWSAYSNGKPRGWGRFYIKGGPHGRYYLHRFIMTAKPGEYVDHINGDSFDNRRENLRIASNLENSWNRHRNTFSRGTSKYRGVCWDKRRKRWQASIYVNSKCTYIGQFATEEAAARAYDAASLEHYGRFGTRNFR